MAAQRSQQSSALALAGQGVAHAAAAAEPLILRAVVTQPGTIHLVVLGRPGDRVDVSRDRGPRCPPPAAIDRRPRSAGSRRLNAAAWICARSSRRFVATNAGGELSYFSVRTPSCRHRIAVAAPASALRGSRVRLRLSDISASGFARACASSPPGGPRGAGRFAFRAGRAARESLQGHRARAAGASSSPPATSARSRTVAVGVPARAARLPQHPLHRRLDDAEPRQRDHRPAGRARRDSERRVRRVGALSKPGFDFVANTRRRARRLRRDGVFLGQTTASRCAAAGGPCSAAASPGSPPTPAERGA